MEKIILDMGGKKVGFNLARHPLENRYLMKWYSLTIPDGRTITFRSEKFVPKKVEEELEEFHCTMETVWDLQRSCIALLEPYVPVIYEELEEFLEDYPTKEFWLKYNKEMEWDFTAEVKFEYENLEDLN